MWRLWARDGFRAEAVERGIETGYEHRAMGT